MTGVGTRLHGRVVTCLLIALNVGYFAWMAAVDNRAFDTLGESAFLTQWGANVRGLTFTGEPWRLLTSMFIHAGLMHLGFNMLALFEIGSAVERRLGALHTLVLYMLAGLGGSLASAWWHDVVAVGASGAIFGLLGVVVVFGFLGRPGLFTPDGRPLSPWRALAMGAITAAMGLFLPLDNAAHAGGFVAGAALALAALVAERVERSSRAGSLIFGAAALALVAAIAAVTWQEQEAHAQTALRVRLARLQETLYSANAEGRSALHGRARTYAEASQAAHFDPTDTTRAQPDEEPTDFERRLVPTLRTYAERNVRLVWPQCHREVGALLSQPALDNRQREVVLALDRYCQARAATDNWLFLDGPKPDLGALLLHLTDYEVIEKHVPIQLRYSGLPPMPLDSLDETLPPHLKALIHTYAVWNSAITADDRELADLNSCPYLSCRRSWARDLPNSILIP